MRQHQDAHAECRHLPAAPQVGDAGDQLPLHTVHGIGYVFLGKLREFAEP